MYSSGCRQVGLSSAVHSSRWWGTPAEARPREGAAVVAAVVVVVMVVAVAAVVVLLVEALGQMPNSSHGVISCHHNNIALHRRNRRNRRRNRQKP